MWGVGGPGGKRGKRCGEELGVDLFFLFFASFGRFSWWIVRYPSHEGGVDGWITGHGNVVFGGRGLPAACFDKVGDCLLVLTQSSHSPFSSSPPSLGCPVHSRIRAPSFRCRCLQQRKRSATVKGRAWEMRKVLILGCCSHYCRYGKHTDQHPWCPFCSEKMFLPPSINES